YLQYGAPGTEFSGYADGLLVGTSPLGPWEPQSDPLSFKPGGFARGAGHGATFQDKFGAYWHVSTMVVSVKNNFERRLGIWPAGFDKDDVMYCNTAFGDYPHYLPEVLKDQQTNSSYQNAGFTGWMLLNYKKPVRVSSTLGNYTANNIVDESIKTYWSAVSSNKGEWVETDLGAVSTVNAIQINYADQDVADDRLGKAENQYHQYKLYYSIDGKNWKLLVDKSRNLTDVPHEYVEPEKPVQARYINLVNWPMPT